MSNLPAFTEWSQLPLWIRAKIEELGIADKEQWIQRKIPALGQKSVFELVGSREGDAMLREYFSKVGGRF